MPLFQSSVLKKHLRNLPAETVGDAWEKFTKHFHDEFAYHIEHKKCLVPVDVQRAGSGFFTATA